MPACYRKAAALLLLASGSSDHRFSALALAFAYAALILSFLGALWWGLAAAQPARAPEWVWPAGVAPSLLRTGRHASPGRSGRNGRHHR
jgi:hypothetical protein